MSNIVHDYIEEYIDKTQKKNEDFFENLRNYAESNHIYIVKRQVEQLLITLVSALKPKKVLELGTAIGYSALLFHEFSGGARVTTIERDSEVLKMAKENIKLRGAEDHINCIFGDASEVLQNLNEKFDLIFIDAAKGQYKSYFDECLKNLNPGGVIITDDVLYMGMTASDELAIKKHITITRRLREFLDYICNDERFSTTILPVGDGVAVTYVKEE